MAAPGSGSGGIPIKADQDSDGSAQSTADMTAFVQNLLMQMCSLDEMGARIDELEQSINDLKVEMGTEGITPTKPKDEESKPAGSSAE
uniref:Heat shock factor binding protein n=1 Tax=Oryza rufipogon TaxID=4529 RepID=A0A0E0PWA7_ORYRU